MSPLWVAGDTVYVRVILCGCEFPQGSVATLRTAIYLTNKNFIETTKKFFTFDVSTSIRGLHQKKLLLGLLLPVLGATS